MITHEHGKLNLFLLDLTYFSNAN